MFPRGFFSQDFELKKTNRRLVVPARGDRVKKCNLPQSGHPKRYFCASISDEVTS